ncbi:hypothetical protein H4R24_000359 [Coemansia sp. RSA 988]|nr:hypothetical protein H4R24_000359 [Coemansia sp. RSA 988]
MRCWLELSMLVALYATSNVNGQSCNAGSYRCGSPSGQGTEFLQCDAGGNEVQKTCAPGTVCFTQGDSILCSYPVSIENQPPPASNSLVAGAQCSFVSSFDEYMCPGPSGQHEYYLRCLSGSFVHFPCPPGTVCMKSEGQNMYCGFRGQSYPDIPADNSTPPYQTSGSASDAPTTSPEIDIGGATSELSLSVDIGGATSELSLSVDIGGATSELSLNVDIGGATSEFELSLNVDIGASTSDSSVIVEIGASAIQASDTTEPPASTDNDESTQGLSGDIPPLLSSTSSGLVESESIGENVETSAFSSSNSFDDTWPSSTVDAEPSMDLSSDITTTADLSSEEEPPQPATTKPDSGLTGPMISSGLQMLLLNGGQLPFTLPDINLPEIDLGTVHLPDMTFEGIAITALELPSITLPPMDPASLTKFDYIESLMNKAGITFDDLAKMPLPDLSHLNLGGLGQIDVASVMSIANVNRISLPDEISAQELAEPLSPITTTALHTTTLDADGIDALLGLSVVTYSTK